MRGCLITIEGGEGSGKSTQLKRLTDQFARSNLGYVQTREPGGSLGGEALRQLLVSGDKDRWDPIAETLLFYAARRDHIMQIIEPARASGTHVICDRFADSTRVYQGIGKGLSLAFVNQLHALTLGNYEPDLTLILDIDPQIGLSRTMARQGNETRFESMPITFHQSIREGFLSIAQQHPQRCVVIDASQSADSVHSVIGDTIRRYLALALV